MKKTDLSKIQTTDEGFNNFIQITLQDLLDDLDESIVNVARYTDLLADEANREMNMAMYGPLLNDALKIKGAARDRIVKVLNLIKDRTKTKEAAQDAKGAGEDWSAEDIDKLTKEIKDKIKIKDGEQG